MISRSLIFLVAVGSGIGCSSRLTSSGGDAGKYEEDLSRWRKTSFVKEVDTVRRADTVTATVERDPNKYVEARHSINQRLDVVLDSISRFNLAEGTVEGYTIQLFSGPNLEQAMNVRKELAITMPEMNAELEYVQPNYKVRMGKYYTRLEAQPTYLKIRRHFPNAIVLPARLPIRN